MRLIQEEFWMALRMRVEMGMSIVFRFPFSVFRFLFCVIGLL